MWRAATQNNGPADVTPRETLTFAACGGRGSRLAEASPWAAAEGKGEARMASRARASDGRAHASGAQHLRMTSRSSGDLCQNQSETCLFDGFLLCAS